MGFRVISAKDKTIKRGYVFLYRNCLTCLSNTHPMKSFCLACFGVILLVLLLFNCTIKTNKPFIKNSKYNKLLSLYQPINIDTLKVFSANDPYSVGYKYCGKRIDTTLLHLLPKEIRSDDIEYFATYKFNIDSNNIGLITRTPGQYSSSSIKLLVYNTKTDTITDYFELAEKWGDAGDVLNKIAWIYKTDDHKFNYLVWEDFSHDNNIENDKDTTVSHDNTYYLLESNNSKHDTLSKKAEALFKKFKDKK